MVVRWGNPQGNLYLVWVFVFWVFAFVRAGFVVWRVLWGFWWVVLSFVTQAPWGKNNACFLSFWGGGTCSRDVDVKRSFRGDAEDEGIAGRSKEQCEKCKEKIWHALGRMEKKR